MPAVHVTAAPALELSAASRSFGSVVGLRAVSLQVDRGGTALVHGPNGSGKTTLLRVCAGVLAPTSGVRRSAGTCLYLRPGSGARRRQTVRDVVATVTALSGRPASTVEDTLALAALAPWSVRRVETLSSGQRSRLLLGIALAALPVVACLDEPAAHLDEDGRAVVRSCVRRLVEAGTAVLVATHDRDLLGREPDARLVVEDGSVRAAA